MARTVHVGEQDRTIAKFNGFKALYAGAIIGRISDEVREIMFTVADFENEYRARNKVILTKQMAVARAAQGAPSYPLEMFGDRDSIELPRSPTPEERVIAGLPKAMNLARQELLMLLALVVIPNRDLEQADDDDEVDETLLKLGKELAHRGDMFELAELIIAAYEELADSINAKSEILGKLQGLLSLILTGSGQQAETEQPEEDSERSSSSTSSPQPTGGGESEPSTEPAGVSSSS
jgi:hypothetical protein